MLPEKTRSRGTCLAPRQDERDAYARMADTTSASAIGPRALVRCPFCLRLNRVDLGRLHQGPRCGSCHRPLRLDRPLAASQEEFDRVIRDTEVPVLVDFYAEWCGPCKVMAPILDEVAHARQGRLLVLKVDTDRNPDLAQRLGIQGVPTLILYRGGQEVRRQVGALPRQALEALLEGVA